MRIISDFRHRNRPAGNMADDVRLDRGDDLPPGYLADAGARHSAGMDLHFDAARVRPSHVALGFPVRQQAVVIKYKLDQLDPQRLDFVEVFFVETRNQQQSARMHFNAGRPQVVVTLLGNDGDGQRRARVWRQRKARQMQFTRRNQRRHAAMHVVGNPTERVLRRRVFADGRMRM